MVIDVPPRPPPRMSEPIRQQRGVRFSTSMLVNPGSSADERWAHRPGSAAVGRPSLARLHEGRHAPPLTRRESAPLISPVPEQTENDWRHTPTPPRSASQCLLWGTLKPAEEEHLSPRPDVAEPPHLRNSDSGNDHVQRADDDDWTYSPTDSRPGSRLKGYHKNIDRSDESIKNLLSKTSGAREAAGDYDEVDAAVRARDSAEQIVQAIKGELAKFSSPRSQSSGY